MSCVVDRKTIFRTLENSDYFESSHNSVFQYRIFKIFTSAISNKKQVQFRDVLIGPSRNWPTFCHHTSGSFK